MSANRPNNSKAAAQGNVCREQRCEGASVDWESRVKHGRFREDGSKMGILILLNQDPGSLRHFLCTLSDMHSEEEWLGGGVERKLPTQQLSDH